MLPIRYRDLLSVPGAPLPGVAALLGRLPEGMLVLSLLLFLQAQSGSFAHASTVGAALMLGWAVGTVVQTRLIDRIGQRRPLLLCGVAHPACVVGLMVAGSHAAPLSVLLALGWAAGVAFPQLGACMRAVWRELLPDDGGRRIAYAWESVTNELFFVLGPALVSGLIVVASPAAALLAAALVTATGTLVFAFATPLPGPPSQTPPARTRGPLRSPGIRTVMMAELASSAALGCLDVAIQAHAVDTGQRALGGVLITMLSLGSVIGGLVYGQRVRGSTPVRRFIALHATFALALVPIALVSTVPLLALLLFVAGAPIAALGTEVALLIDGVAPAGMGTESYGWMLTGVVVGAAIGVALGGSLADARSPQAALVAAALCGGIATLVATLRRGTLAPAQP